MTDDLDTLDKVLAIKDNTELCNEFNKFVSNDLFMSLNRLINRNDPSDNNELSWFNTLGSEMKYDKGNKEVLNANILMPALRKYAHNHPNLNQWVIIRTYWNRDFMFKAVIKPITTVPHQALSDLADLMTEDLHLE